MMIAAGQVMVFATIVEQGGGGRVHCLAVTVAAIVPVRAGQIWCLGYDWQRAVFATHIWHKERLPFVAHGLNLAQEHCVISAGILSRNARVNEAHCAVEDRRTRG